MLSSQYEGGMVVCLCYFNALLSNISAWWEFYLVEFSTL